MALVRLGQIKIDNTAGGAITNQPVGLWLPSNWPWAMMHTKTGDEDWYFEGKNLRIRDDSGNLVNYALSLLPDVAAQKGFLHFQATVGAGAVKYYPVYFYGASEDVWPYSCPWAVFDAYEDFETGTVGLFRNVSANDYFSLATTPVIQGEKTLRLDDNSAVNSSDRYSPANTIIGTAQETISWISRAAEVGANKKCTLNFIRSGNYKLYLGHIDGKFQYYDNGAAWVDTGISITADTWYIHKLNFRFTDGKFDWQIYDISYNSLYSIANRDMITVGAAVTDVDIYAASTTTCDDYFGLMFSYPYVATEPTVTYLPGGGYYYELVRRTRI